MTLAPSTELISMKICHGLGCRSTELIKAHIIPQSFGRYVEGNSGPNVMLSSEGRSMKTPRGLFDTGILCATCDGYLNKKYDDPAFHFFKSFDLASTKIIDLNPAKYHGAPPFFEASGVDCDMLCGFILSALWRSSISSRPEVSSVRLGPYEDKARDVLWGVQPLSSLPAFEVTLQRYRSHQVDIHKTYSLPGRLLPDPLIIYGFACLGFRIHAKMDRRPFPAYFNGFVINSDKVFRGLIIDFEETREARELCKMANEAAKRRHQRRR
jgi:hypothetical protein